MGMKESNDRPKKTYLDDVKDLYYDTGWPAFTPKEKVEVELERDLEKYEVAFEKAKKKEEERVRIKLAKQSGEMFEGNYDEDYAVFMKSEPYYDKARKEVLAEKGDSIWDEAEAEANPDADDAEDYDGIRMTYNRILERAIREKMESMKNDEER